MRFLPYEQALTNQERIIAIPFDIPVPNAPEQPYKVWFNGTELTLWNRIETPSGDWSALPDESSPLWYQNKHGTLMPAWNLFGNLFWLLTFGEERECRKRDKHGRFVAAFSPRLSAGLLEVPALNEAAAALVGAMAGVRAEGKPAFNVNSLVKRPVISLSHDCDILRGNDIWTQAVRAARIFLPILKLRLPKISNAWWIIRNVLTPRRFYFDNVTGMIDLERCFGYNSTFYILNGNGGRFGARSGFDLIPELVEEIPAAWDTGMHYNYDTFLNDERFSDQIKQLQELNEQPPKAGRAHYMRFDSEKSFTFLQEHGITTDESCGFPDHIGYRNGIAGCFRAFDPAAKKELGIWEVPLSVMDSTLVRQYGHDSVKKVSKMLRHLKCIGGALTVLFHPGLFYNPEHKEMLGIYHRILMEARQLEARSVTARKLVAAIGEYGRKK